MECTSPGPLPPLRWGARDGAILAALVVLGLVYYGQYYDCGFNTADEGSAVLITGRLLDGERPFVDIELGYGLLWYYPLVLLFKLIGPSFVAMRIGFLSLALTTSLLAFLTIRRQVHRRGLAAIVAILAILVPGTLHKAFIPLIVVANMLFLPSFSRGGPSIDRREVFGAGLVAAISYHIRPDLGLVAGLVLITTLVTRAVSRASGGPRLARELGRLSSLLGAAALVPTVPLLIVARRQGFLDPLLVSLYRPVRFLRESAQALLGLFGHSARPRVGPRAPSAEPSPSAAEPALEEAGARLARVPWEALWEEGPRQSLAILTYLPLLILTVIFVVACVLALRKRLRSGVLITDETAGVLALGALAGSALPQFLFFRPDVAHLSQFMPGFFVLCGVCLGLWFFPRRPAVSGPSSLSVHGRRWRGFSRVLASGFLISYLGFYVWFGLRHTACGSIALARNRTERYRGANGVDVLVSPPEKKMLSASTQIIEENTDRGDFLLCLPYCPGLNVITDRPSFLRRLYVDDSILLLDPNWQRRTIERSEAEQVPLIVIQGGALNQTEISRFRNWASEMMRYLDDQYELIESVGSFDFYLRRNNQGTDPPRGR